MSAQLHLYALLDEPPEAPPLRGAFGERLLQVEASSLVAVAGELDAAPRDDQAAAVAHAGLVETLGERARSLLPSQFGVRFESVEELRATLDAESERLRSALAAVRDCVEIGLTAVFPAESPPAAPRTGREYLGRRVDASRRLDRL